VPWAQVSRLPLDLVLTAGENTELAGLTAPVHYATTGPIDAAREQTLDIARAATATLRPTTPTTQDPRPRVDQPTGRGTTGQLKLNVLFDLIDTDPNGSGRCLAVHLGPYESPLPRPPRMAAQSRMTKPRCYEMLIFHAADRFDSWPHRSVRR